MASSADINKLIQDIMMLAGKIEAVLPNLAISGKQVIVAEGLSDISEKLGLVSAGEFRTGNGRNPGSGFSGVRIAYPPLPYSNEEWNIAGIENDILQVGIRASDGKLYGGGGAAVISSEGIQILRDGVPTVSLSAAGDVSFGSDVRTQDGTTFRVFASEQTYGGETLYPGDLLIGSNTEGTPNLKWAAQTGQLQIRLGQQVVSSTSAVRAAVVGLSGDQAVTTSTPTLIDWDAAEYDIGGFFSGSSALLAELAGLYTFNLAVEVALDSSAPVTVDILVNDVVVATQTQTVQNGTVNVSGGTNVPPGAVVTAQVTHTAASGSVKPALTKLTIIRPT